VQKSFVDISTAIHLVMAEKLHFSPFTNCIICSGVVSCAVPVGNVSWMLFQEGRSTKFRLRRGQLWCMYICQTHIYLLVVYQIAGLDTTTCFGHNFWPSSGCTMKTYQVVIQLSLSCCLEERGCVGVRYRFGREGWRS
jgi:hypothetical protein